MSVSPSASTLVYWLCWWVSCSLERGICWLVDWSADLIDWWTGQLMVDWLVGARWFVGFLGECCCCWAGVSISRLVDWLVDDWLIGHLMIGGLVCWLVDWSVSDWLLVSWWLIISWLISWWLNNWLIGWLISWCALILGWWVLHPCKRGVCWLIDWWVGWFCNWWLIGWLITDWLSGAAVD